MTFRVDFIESDGLNHKEIVTASYPLNHLKYCIR